MKAETYQDIGDLLRHNRERLGVDLLSAAHALHIRAKYLEALEEGRMADLPGIAYARGYVINYGSYLGLERNDMAVMFDSIGVLHARSFFHLPDTMKKEQKPSRRLVWISLAATFALAAAWSASLRNDRLPLAASVMHVATPESAPPAASVVAVAVPATTAAAPMPAPAPQVILPPGFSHPCVKKSVRAYPPCTARFVSVSTAPVPKVRSLVEFRDATPVKSAASKQAAAVASAPAKRKPVNTHVYSPPEPPTAPLENVEPPSQH
jgi:hypothetical protein